MIMEQPPGYKLNYAKNLGSGAFGQVYKAIQKATEVQVAVKIIQLKKMKGQYFKKSLAQEIQITQNLRGPNVIRFIDFVAGQNHAFIVLELCQQSLDEKLPKLNWSQSQRETQSVLMLTQIVNGYRTLILKNILHRDLKPANILLKNNIIKISDFGFSKRILDPLTLNKTCVGTPYYQSLQLLGAQLYTSKSDVWALGIIFYELLHGHRPWTAQTRQELYNNIKVKPLVIDQKLQDHTKDFLRRTLSLYEKDRMTWIQVFNHPIFRGFFNMQMYNSTFEVQLREALKQKVTKYKLQSLKQTLLGQKQMLFQQFYELLQSIDSKISLNLGIYAFNRADVLTNGIITKEQLDTFLDRFVTYKFSEMNPRMMQYFDLFQKVLKTTKLSLKYVFDFYKQKQDGNLKKQGFTRLIRHLDQSKTISQEDIQYAFKLIDVDSSGTIEYHEIQKFFTSK